MKLTLVAVWQTTQICTITFNLNGGYGDFPDITINRLEKIEEPSAKPAKAGNHFKYWALSTDLTKEYNWNNLVSENITLIAVWENFNQVSILMGELRLLELLFSMWVIV